LGRYDRTRIRAQLAAAEIEKPCNAAHALAPVPGFVPQKPLKRPSTRDERADAGEPPWSLVYRDPVELYQPFREPRHDRLGRQPLESGGSSVSTVLKRRPPELFQQVVVGRNAVA
jgi:hypothetical protein